MIDYGLITRQVAAMQMHYGHADPREILTDLGISLLEMPMGKNEDAIKGFLLKNNRCETVGINTDLSEEAQNKVLFHEIGHHACGHLNHVRYGALRDTSFGYRSDTTQLSRFENEANFFASDYILDTEETLEAIHEYDLASAARLLRVPIEFLDYKLRLLHQTGVLAHYYDCISVQSDCMRNMRLSDPLYE